MKKFLFNTVLLVRLYILLYFHSLSKSETKCKTSERFCKNADAKKAKRRIKDAQKTLQDFTISNTVFGIATLVADQITLLCQQLMQIPLKLEKDEVEYEHIEVKQGEKSDSESDGSSRVNTPVNHIYSEIDVNQSRNSTYITPRRSTCYLSEDSNKNKESFNEESSVPRLNSVVLFSSDSEEEYGFGTKMKIHSSKRSKSASSGSRQSRPGKKAYTNKSKSPDYEILDKPTRKDLFRGSESTRISPRLQKSPVPTSPSPKLYDEYEKPLKREHESLSEPIKEYMKQMSPVLKKNIKTDETGSKTFARDISDISAKSKDNSLNVFSVSKVKNDSSPLAERVAHKRLLPATPRPEQKTDTTLDDTRQRLHSTYFHPKFHLGTDHADIILPEDTVDSVCLSTANTTTELFNAAQHLLDVEKISCKPSDPNSDNECYKTKTESSSDKISPHEISQDNDYIDIDEIKFRETVRSARREIIDKLKSKYTQSCNSLAVANVSEKDYCSKNNKKYQEQRTGQNKCLSTNHDYSNSRNPGVNDINSPVANYTNKVTEITNDISSKTQIKKVKTDTLEDAKNENVGLFRSKLIYTYDMEHYWDNTSQGQKQADCSNSLVASKIKLFEKEEAASENSYHKTKKHKHIVKYGVGARHRSISEPRTAVSSLIPQTQIYPSYLKQPNKALQPRYRSQNQDRFEIEQEENDNNESRKLTRSCTESDLQKLVGNESSSSIRREWSKRRSSSMTPKITGTRNNLGPTYEHWITFQIPKQTSRCFVSAIVVLNDMSVILLDERHCFLHLFDRLFKFKDQYRLLDVPKGCVKVKPEIVAVAFPYKKCICTYCIEMNAILSGSEISVPCREWIVGIEFSKNLFYILCKAGEIHIMKDSGFEYHRISVGMTGSLFIPPTTKYINILGEGRVSKFDINGIFISSKTGIDAHSMIYIENRIYVADRQRHKLVPLSGFSDVQNLIDMKIEYPSAMGTSLNGDILLVSQFEEAMDMALTRSIEVFRLKRT